LGIAGILSGTLLILTGVRLVITVLGALGILHQVKRQAEQQQKLPLQPSF
jgi:hypothetical protein